VPESSFLRALISPAPAVEICDRVNAALTGHRRLLPARVDIDLDCAVWNVEVLGDLKAAIAAVARALGPAHQSCSIMFDAQSTAPVLPDESFGREIEGLLGAAVGIVLRDQPASQWVSRRALTLGPDGFAVRHPHAFGSQSAATDRGVLVEFGTPTQVLKVELNGVPADALSHLCHAAGDEHGGLLHIGAYPGISRCSGQPLVVLECSDGAKSPLHRALSILDIEAARYGGAVGRTVALSFLPLDGLLRTLAARMPLDASANQVIETHLDRARA
jgi:hypothetical protein